MINTSIGPLCYVRLAVDDVPASANFLEQIVGLRRNGERDGEVRLRADWRDHAVSVVADGQDGIGIELGSMAQLAGAAEAIAARGLPIQRATAAECASRAAIAAYLAKDASGNAIDLLFRPFMRGSRLFPTRDNGVEMLKNVGLRSTNISEDVALWTDVLGATVADWVGEATYLRLGDEHHSVALYPSARRGVLYATFAVREFDDLMRNYHFLKAHQVEILQGPGRETASGQRFVRFRGPEGRVFAFGEGMADHVAGRRPRQFTLEPSSFCDLGSEAVGIPELSGRSSATPSDPGARRERRMEKAA